MTDWITSIMEGLGYLGIGLLMLMENVFPPIPSEMIMPLAGFTASEGQLGIVMVIVAGSVGSLLGAVGWYWIASLFGAERIRAWTARYGRWFGITTDEFDQARDWFDRHGRAAVFFGRLVPGVRTLISIPAGLSGMPIGSFFVYTLAGTVLWTSLLALAGYILGANWRLVEEYMGPVSKIVLVTLVLGFAIWIFRRNRARKRGAA